MPHWARKNIAIVFLSTLSLRRATVQCFQSLPCFWVFLSTLSLRRATRMAMMDYSWTKISIHALLAESDVLKASQTWRKRNFYPRSPCGERRSSVQFGVSVSLFLSTLSLRRATDAQRGNSVPRPISIHALLAESDMHARNLRSLLLTFLSTLSLRRATLIIQKNTSKRRTQFLSTLSLRRATSGLLPCRPSASYFYPRSPCGERLVYAVYHLNTHVFLSTLSLRRATNLLLKRCRTMRFLSTLSLRRAT